jgi:uncharacterized RDD family membrane protein YckC
VSLLWSFENEGSILKNATLDERFKAFMIDWAVWSVIGLVTFLVANLITQDTRIMFISVSPFCFWLLFKDLAGNGVGKKRMNLSIINISTGVLVNNPFTLLIRNVTITLWVIDLPMLFFSNDGRRLGEKITNTRVIRNN